MEDKQRPAGFVLGRLDSETACGLHLREEIASPRRERGARNDMSLGGAGRVIFLLTHLEQYRRVGNFVISCVQGCAGAKFPHPYP